MFICRAEAKDARISPDGENLIFPFIYSFSVKMDESGAVREVNIVDIEIEPNQQFYGFWSKLRKKVKEVVKKIPIQISCKSTMPDTCRAVPKPKCCF
jgi:hypothetical protein